MSLPPSDPSDVGLIIVHMPGNEATCLCHTCCHLREEVGDDIDDAMYNAAFDAIANDEAPPAAAGAPNNGRTTPPTPPAQAPPLDAAAFATATNAFSAAALPVVTPNRNKRNASRITLPIFTAATTPEGRFCNGFQGKDSVLFPRGFGNMDTKSRQLINDLARVSGSLPFTKAALLLSSVDVGKAGPDDVAFAGDVLSEEDLALHNLSAMGVDTNDGIVTGVSQFLSPVVEQCFMGPMDQLGVHNIDGLNHFTRQIDDDGLEILPNAKGSFLFTPVMIRDKKVSTVNNHNRPEFERVATPTGPKVLYNCKFWEANLVVKTLSPTTFFSTLDVGFYMPIWSIPPDVRAHHSETLEWMKDNGPVLHGGIGYLSLKQDYAHVFLHNMSSDLVVRGRIAGFFPIFLMKNCLLQRTKQAFAVNGYQFSSMNKKPKSYMTLVGFYKGKEEDGTLSVITITNTKNELLTIYNNNN